MLVYRRVYRKKNIHVPNHQADPSRSYILHGFYRWPPRRPRRRTFGVSAHGKISSTAITAMALFGAIGVAGSDSKMGGPLIFMDIYIYAY